MPAPDRLQPTLAVTTRPLTAQHMVLGAGVLALISDWNNWVARRVDSFCFTGDDERVLERRQSMDFMLPDLANDLASLTRLGGVPVPITFVNKWRMPQFSLRDEDERSLPLLSRSESTSIATGMLIALANLCLQGSMLPVSEAVVPEAVVPAAVSARLNEIVSSDPSYALSLCAGLRDLRSGDMAGTPPQEASAGEWFTALASDELFMSLAYELARGFLLLALCPAEASGRHVLKFSYSSYVVPAKRDRPTVRAAHLCRRISQRSGDVMDSVAWHPRSKRENVPTGRIVFSTVCTAATDSMLEDESTVACAEATVDGPTGRTLTLRLRANAAMALEHAPTGWYVVTVASRSGFQLQTRRRSSFFLKQGASERVEVRAIRGNIAARITKAPTLLARPASVLRDVLRGFGWFSKPLAIRVRVGDGGSYHCEFKAPPGMHVTRARLISNADPHDDYKRSRELDLVLASTQHAHLYAPSQESSPAAAYAFFNLRPRVETVVRPGFLTAWFAFAALGFVALMWRTANGFTEHGPSDSSALLVLLLGAPSGLAAYFAQAVSSRVTNSMLYGVRLTALLPGVLAMFAGGTMLVGKSRHGAHLILWVLAVLAFAVILVLWATQRCAEHPPEQRSSDLGQGDDFERAYSATDRAGDSLLVANSASGEAPDTSLDHAEAVSDRMLERAGGFSRATRRMLLSQRGRLRGEFKVPPALYFDSAETPPTFVGLGDSFTSKSLCVEVQDFVADAKSKMQALENVSGEEQGQKLATAPANSM